MTTTQPDLFTAREAGNQAASACLDKAKRIDPEFPEKAKKAILAHLSVVRECSGEDLVDVAMAMGARPHDMRSFGGVFTWLVDRHKIRVLRSDLPRKRGHGTSGGKLYGIVH